MRILQLYTFLDAAPCNEVCATLERGRAEIRAEVANEDVHKVILRPYNNMTPHLPSAFCVARMCTVIRDGISNPAVAYVNNQALKRQAHEAEQEIL